MSPIRGQVTSLLPEEKQPSPTIEEQASVPFLESAKLEMPLLLSASPSAPLHGSFLNVRGHSVQFSSVQSLSRIRLFATP